MKALLAAAVAMSLAAPAAANAELGLRRQPDIEGGPIFGPSARKGKGKGKRPHHPSRRFVAQDKREARKARRRG